MEVEKKGLHHILNDYRVAYCNTIYFSLVEDKMREMLY
jgi:hypothetical protein